MTLQALKDYLAGLPWIGAVLGDENFSNPDDVAKYGISNVHIYILEESGMVAKKRTIHCYVKNLGGKDEVAFFDGRIPVPELTPAVKVDYIANSDGTVYEEKKVISLDGEERVISEKSTLEAVSK